MISLSLQPVLKSLLISSLLFSALSCSEDEGTPVTDNEDDQQTEMEYSLDYVKTLGGNNIDDAVSVVEADNGSYMILATTESTTGDVTGKTTNDKDLWLVNVSKDGTIISDLTFGGTKDDIAKSMRKTSDGGYIISAQSRSDDGDVSNNEGFFDFWIVKINSSGTIQWETSFGFLGSDQVFDVIETQDGGYFATGVLDVSASNGQGNSGKAANHAGGDYWAIKMNASGDLLWSKYYGGSFTDTAHRAIETNTGEFIIIGFSDSTDFDISNNKGAYDFWIIKVSATGDLIWEKSFGGSEIDIAYSITETNDSGYLVVGDTRSSNTDVSEGKGNADTWVAKISTEGALVWQKSIGGSEFDSARSISAMANGNFAIGGNTRSADGDVAVNKGQNDAWIIIINETGDLQQQFTFGGSSLDFGNDVIQTSDNSLVLVGNTESNDLDIETNKGIKDLVIIKLKQ